MRGFAQFIWGFLSLIMLFAAWPVGLIMFILLAFDIRAAARDEAAKEESEGVMALFEQAEDTLNTLPGNPRARRAKLKAVEAMLTESITSADLKSPGHARLYNHLLERIYSEEG